MGKQGVKNIFHTSKFFLEYQLKKEADQLQFTDMEAENKENKVPPKSDSATPTEPEVAVEKKKKGRQFQRPSIEHISEEDFEKLGRHDKGRLKYKQVFDTIEKVRVYLDCYKETGKQGSAIWDPGFCVPKRRLAGSINLILFSTYAFFDNGSIENSLQSD